MFKSFDEAVMSEFEKVVSLSHMRSVTEKFGSTASCIDDEWKPVGESKSNKVKLYPRRSERSDFCKSSSFQKLLAPLKNSCCAETQG